MGAGKEGVSSLFSRTTLAHAIAGSMGSIVAMTLTYPLDRVRTDKQLSKGTDDNSVIGVIRRILKREGWTGLYKGLSPMLVALGTSNFVYFYFFTALKVGMQYFLRSRAIAKGLGLKIHEGGAFQNLALASIAGTINVLITTPLWVAYTRLVVQGTRDPKDETQYNGVLDALRKIAEKDGMGALWSGMGPSLILVSNPSVQFASYEWLKRAVLKIRFNSIQPPFKDHTHIGDILDDKTQQVESEAVIGPELGSLEYLILGALAKMIATVVTYPLQIAQTRLRAQTNASKAGDDNSRSNKAKATGTIDCLTSIYKSEGIKGWYRGMDAKLLQTCLNSAFMFAAYERICAFILRLILWRKFTLKSE